MAAVLEERSELDSLLWGLKMHMPGGMDEYQSASGELLMGTFSRQCESVDILFLACIYCFLTIS